MSFLSSIYSFWAPKPQSVEEVVKKGREAKQPDEITLLQARMAAFPECLQRIGDAKSRNREETSCSDYMFKQDIEKLRESGIYVERFPVPSVDHSNDWYLSVK